MVGYSYINPHVFLPIDILVNPGAEAKLKETCNTKAANPLGTANGSLVFLSNLNVCNVCAQLEQVAVRQCSPMLALRSLE